MLSDLKEILSLSKEEKFEYLRLYFTTLFLKQPKMLEALSFKDIVRKAAEFTKEYINYGK